MKRVANELRRVPGRALFWMGVLLITSGALKIEELSE